MTTELTGVALILLGVVTAMYVSVLLAVVMIVLGVILMVKNHLR